MKTAVTWLLIIITMITRQANNISDDSINTTNSGGSPSVRQETMYLSDIADTSVFGMVDSHCDTITAAMDNGQGMYENNLHLDFARLKEFGAPIQVFSVWCADAYLDDAFAYTNKAIDFFLDEIEAHSESIALAKTASDLAKNAIDGKISAILAIEGGEALEGKIENLEHFYNRGVRLITLTWNRENALGHGALTNSNKGLKPFGIECIKKMNELGMIIDVSHLNEAGFWDVHNISEKPYMASHSNAYAIAANKRNLTDPQIKAIAEKGGIIGINLYPNFLTNTRNAATEDILKHIRHMNKLGAAKNIGLGCDFDGVGILPAGISGVSQIKTLAENISGEFGDEFAAQIMYNNYIDFFIRFFD